MQPFTSSHSQKGKPHDRDNGTKYLYIALWAFPHKLFELFQFFCRYDILIAFGIFTKMKTKNLLHRNNKNKETEILWTYITPQQLIYIALCWKAKSTLNVAVADSEQTGWPTSVNGQAWTMLRQWELRPTDMNGEPLHPTLWYRKELHDDDKSMWMILTHTHTRIRNPSFRQGAVV